MKSWNGIREAIKENRKDLIDVEQMIRMERDKKTLSKSEWRMSEYDDRESKNKLI